MAATARTPRIEPGAERGYRPIRDYAVIGDCYGNGN